MSYTFGKPQPAAPYTGVGEFKSEPFVLSLLTRVKIVVRAPQSWAAVGEDVPADFEPQLRQIVAERLVGIVSGDLTVVYAAVEQFEDAQG